MKNMLKAYPDWLYNSLAYVYVGAGVLTVVLLPNIMGAASGVLLVLAGATVWTLRYRYRKEFTHYEKHLGDPSILDVQDIPNGGLVQMSWSKSYECGQPVIDGQHRRLFGLANEAIQTLLDKQPKPVEELLLSKMAAHLADHFHTEEAVLAKVDDANIAEHKEQHQALLDKSAILFARYRQGELDNRELVTFLANDVIARHILKEDLPTSPLSYAN